MQGNANDASKLLFSQGETFQLLESGHIDNRINVQLSEWPSGLRRQTQGITLLAIASMRHLVHVYGRGFKSHF